MVSKITEKSHLFSNKLELIYLALTVNLLVFRIVFPFLEYLFVPAALLLGGYFIYLFWIEKKRFFIITEYVRTFYLFILVGLAYLIPLTYTTGYSVLLLREALAVLFFMFLALVFIFFIRSEDQYQIFQKEYLRQVKIISIVAAILGITKYIIHLYGYDLPFLMKNGLYPAGTSLKLDHNFFSLTSFFGMLLIFLELRNPLSKKRRILYQLLMFLLTVNIFFSTSRRGIFLLTIFLAGSLFTSVLGRIKGQLVHQYIKKANNLNLYWILTLLFFTSGILFVWKLDPSARLKIARSLKMKTLVVNQDLTGLIYEYSTIFDRRMDLSQTDRWSWTFQQDPLDPATGWGTRVYKPVYDLTGPGSEQIPIHAIGYKLDKTSNPSTLKGNSSSYTLIGDSIIHSGEIVTSSVYCYVSKDFNGERVRLNAEGNSFGDKIAYYDLKLKGTWQKLEIKPKCRYGKVPVYLYFTKYGSDNFDSLEGYVIFAYPEYKKIKIDPLDPATGWGTRVYKPVYNLTGPGSEQIPTDAVGYKLDKTSNASTSKGNSSSYTLIGDSIINSDEIVISSVYCYVSEDFNGDWAKLSAEGNSYGDKIAYYDLNFKGTWQKLEIKPKSRHGRVPVYLYFAKYGSVNFNSLEGYVIFTYPEYKKVKISSQDSTKFVEAESYEQKQKFIDTLSNKILAKVTKTPPAANQIGEHFQMISNQNLQLNILSKFLSLSYSQKEQNNLNDTLEIVRSSDQLVAGRVDRWRFAFEYFNKKYDGFEKIFGGGFDYLQAYGLTFFNDPDHMDYPHNTLISSVLYSGILGGIIYLAFLFQSFYYYFKYRKYHFIFLVFYLLTFFYVFFSSNSHFELPLFTFLSIIPFYTHYIALKEKKQKNELLRGRATKYL